MLNGVDEFCRLASRPTQIWPDGETIPLPYSPQADKNSRILIKIIIFTTLDFIGRSSLIRMQCKRQCCIPLEGVVDNPCRGSGFDGLHALDNRLQKYFQLSTRQVYPHT